MDEKLRELIQRIPKTDLHVHLDGSLRLGTLIDLAKADGIELPSYDEAGLKETVFKDQYADLPDYLKGFAFTCAVLQSGENLERIAYELGQDNIAENVRYVEVRFAPQLHIREGLPITEIIQSVCRGLDRAKQEHNASDAVVNGDDIPFEYGLILCAMRSFNEHMSPYYKEMFQVMRYAPEREVFATASLELARASEVLAHEMDLPVVGFDLAGAESGFPALDHKEAYQYAHSHFIKKTVHAGEAYGPESIFQAITECYANRIGHGTFLFDADQVNNPNIKDPKAFVHHLAEYIASQRIAFEVCPTSNLQTIPDIKDVSQHPLRKMLEHNLSVTICTDNRLVSSTTVSDEFIKVVESLDISLGQLKNLVVAGFKGSFFPGSYREKRSYVRKALNRYETLEREILQA
jgi:adenosine deaminase